MHVFSHWYFGNIRCPLFQVVEFYWVRGVGYREPSESQHQAACDLSVYQKVNGLLRIPRRCSYVFFTGTLFQLSPAAHSTDWLFSHNLLLVFSLMLNTLPWYKIKSLPFFQFSLLGNFLSFKYCGSVCWHSIHPVNWPSKAVVNSL